MRNWKLKLIVVLGLAAVFARFEWAQQRPVATAGPASQIHPAPPNYAYPDGTTYVYQAEWRLWTAGTATLSINANGTDMQRVNGVANASGVVALLYPVRDRFQSVFDKRSFCSQNLTKHTEEGFHKRETLISFNYTRHVSVLDETNLRNGATKHTENEIPGCVSDVLSGIFYVAAQPLTVGATYTFPLNDGGKTVDVQAKVEERETVPTPSGTYQTLRVAPTASSGVLKDKGNIWIWFTDDARRIPVQMRARMFWGTLTFRLVRVDRK